MATDNTLSIVVAVKDEGTKKIKDFQKSVDTLGSTVKNSLKVAGASIFALGGFALNAAADAEQMKVSFTTMLGSAEKAGAFIKELTTFAKNTPFELAGLQDSAKKLLAYGSTQDNVLTQLKSLGDIAAGVGQDKLPQLILAFGQVQTATRLTGNELRQFGEAGVPLLGILAEKLNKTAAEVQDMASKGQISFEQVEAALTSLTSEGGKFYDLMSKQSQTLTGKISNLRDAWNIFLVGQGQKVIEWAKDFIDKVIYIVDTVLPAFLSKIDNLDKWFQKYGVTLGDVIKGLIGSAGLVYAYFKAQAAIQVLGGALAALAVKNGIATASTTVLRAALLGLPIAISIGIALVGVALVMTQIATLKRQLNDTKDEMAAVKETSDKAIEFNKALQKSSNKTAQDIGKVGEMAYRTQKETADLVSQRSTVGKSIGAFFGFGEGGKLQAQIDINNNAVLMAKKDIAAKVKTLDDKTIADIDNAANKVVESTKKITDAVAKGGVEFPKGMGATADGASKEVEKITEKLEDVAKEYESFQESGKTSLEELRLSHVENVTKINERLIDLQESYKVTKDKLAEDLQELKESHQKNLDSITEQISGVQKKMLELKDSLGTDNAKNITGLAEAFVEAEQGVKKLQDQIAKENDFAQKATLEAQLAKEQNALEKNKDLAIQFQNQIDAAREYSNLTDIEKAVLAYQEKAKLIQAEFTEKMSLLEQEKVALNAKWTEENTQYNKKIAQINKESATKLASIQADIDAYTAQQLEEQTLYDQKVAYINETIATAEQYRQELIAQTTKFTVDSLQKEIDKYKELENAIRRAQSASSNTLFPSTKKSIPAFANGGLVTKPTIGLIGEAGPEVVIPLNKMKNAGGGGLTIIVNGDVTGEDLIDRVGKELTRRLQLSTAVA